METIPTYSSLIAEEKEKPQEVFNKTNKCPNCGHCHYERWTKESSGKFIDDGR
jgi:hypothetical protein